MASAPVGKREKDAYVIYQLDRKYKDTNLEACHRRVELIKVERNELNAQLRLCESQRQTLKTRLTTCDRTSAEAKRMRARLRPLETEVSRLRQERRNLQEQVNRQHKYLEQLQHEVNETDRSRMTLKHQLGNANARIHRFNAQGAAELRKYKLGLEQARYQLKLEIRRYKERLKKQEKEWKERGKRKNKDLKTKVLTLREELRLAKETKKTLQETIDRLNKDFSRVPDQQRQAVVEGLNVLERCLRATGYSNPKCCIRDAMRVAREGGRLNAKRIRNVSTPIACARLSEKPSAREKQETALELLQLESEEDGVLGVVTDEDGFGIALVTTMGVFPTEPFTPDDTMRRVLMSDESQITLLKELSKTSRAGLIKADDAMLYAHDTKHKRRGVLVGTLSGKIVLFNGSKDIRKKILDGFATAELNK